MDRVCAALHCTGLRSQEWGDLHTKITSDKSLRMGDGSPKAWISAQDLLDTFPTMTQGWAVRLVRVVRPPASHSLVYHYLDSECAKAVRGTK